MDVADRIAAWEAAGLIDGATAERLRAHEAAGQSKQAAPAVAGDGTATIVSGPTPLAAIFGPAVTIGEMFAYLGGAFLLGAYVAFVSRIAADIVDEDRIRAVGAIVAAAALTLGALALRSGDARRRRAAGTLFALATGSTFIAAIAYGAGSGLQGEPVAVLAATVAVAVAAALRWIHPALLTQLALIVMATGLGAATLIWLQAIADPLRFTDPTSPERPSAVVLLLASATWWLAVALIIGLIGLHEARRGHRDPAAGRRAALTRLWAGLVAVVGVATTIMRSEHVGGGEFGRTLEPWLADFALLVLAAVLVERAFRRGSSSFIYAAALALIVALTDFNFSYLSASSEVGLLLEGMILLGAGFVADRLRRRVRHGVTHEAVEVAPTTSSA